MGSEEMGLLLLPEIGTLSVERLLRVGIANSDQLSHAPVRESLSLGLFAPNVKRPMEAATGSGDQE